MVSMYFCRISSVHLSHTKKYGFPLTLMKIGTNTTLYLNCIIQQDLCQYRPSAHITTRQLYTSVEEA